MAIRDPTMVKLCGVTDNVGSGQKVEVCYMNRRANSCWSSEACDVVPATVTRLVSVTNVGDICMTSRVSQRSTV
eukprot:10333665-Ditylum_brightwellii.AAC.1